jgi:hypothetical protein
MWCARGWDDQGSVFSPEVGPGFAVQRALAWWGKDWRTRFIARHFAQTELKHKAREIVAASMELIRNFNLQCLRQRRAQEQELQLRLEERRQRRQGLTGPDNKLNGNSLCLLVTSPRDSESLAYS